VYPEAPVRNLEVFSEILLRIQMGKSSMWCFCQGVAAGTQEPTVSDKTWLVPPAIQCFGTA